LAVILIVDDDVLSREFLLALLGYCGHELIEAADGLQGLKLARERIPGLIITDILMPHMDGYEFVSRLHAADAIRDIPVIFYTANYREREANMMALACNVRWVLPKPSDPDLILMKVNDALGLPADHANHPLVNPPPPETSRYYSIDNQVSEYLFELETSNHLISQIATGSDKGLLQMSQRISKSLASLQAVSLRLTSLIDLGIQLTAERDEVGLLKSGCKVAQNICLAKYAAIGILDEKGLHLQHFVTCGLDVNAMPRLNTAMPFRGVLGELLKQREPVRLVNEDGDPKNLGFDGAHPPIHSFLGVPIPTRGKNLGWLYLVDKLGTNKFSEIDEKIASTVAAQLAVAYDNLLLMDQARNHHAQLEAEMAARMRVMDELRRFRSAMDASADAIFLLDHATMRLLDVNNTACELLGYSRAELLAISPESLSGRSDWNTLVGIDGKPDNSTEYATQLYNQIFTYSGPEGTTEVELRRKDGASLPVEIVRRVVQTNASWIMVVIARDITERREAERQLKQLAHYDTLTGLPNRMLFYNTLTHALQQAAIHQSQVAVLFVDLDRFKNVNDTLGHPIGDELLRQFALRVLSCVRVRDTIGRIGGDEFALILTIPEGQQTAALIAQKIHEVLRQPFNLREHEVTIAASIGITIFPDDARDPETLIKFADTAMYQAKESGRDTYRFFTQEMNTQAQKRLELENALRRALENNEFTLYFQPQVSISSGKIIGAEALIRWSRPGHGLVSPADFIPILEDTGLIVRVGTWVLRTACRQISIWHKLLHRPMKVAINVSGKQFYDTHLEADVMDALKEYDVAPEFLEIELTESALMANPDQTTVLLGHLNDLGVKISIDDFGTGYSSLAYLKRFPIDKLKVDIAFIREVTTNPDDAAITKAIIHMAHSLKLSVIAEGVETQDQFDFLRENKCDEIQGYFFSRPVTASEFEAMVEFDKSLPVTSVETIKI
jgi:diguanylate cyclase (GGDEF)-like protein/PAS domain S-box-containing protein